MQTWLELLRRHYNYCLGQRFDWWTYNRCDINSCPLVCGIAEPANPPNYYEQQNNLPNTKLLFSQYKEIYSQVLQNCVKRVDLAYQRFVTPDATGKRFGKPRFKGKGRYRSFTYTQVKPDCIDGNKITLPKIGDVKFVYHRPIPEGFKIKTATISLKADGWYIALNLEDKSIPKSTPDFKATLDNTTGIDVGLKDFFTTSDNEVVPIPQFYRKAEKRLSKLQRKLTSKTNKSSKRRAKVAKRVAKQHLKVFNKRKDFHYKTAKWLLSKSLCISHEDLNIKGLAKTHLGKSINDAAWGSFLQILKVKAESAGQLVIAVDPRNTSQLCSNCGCKVPKTLSERIHNCNYCGFIADRDYNAAINIKKRAEGHPVLVEETKTKAQLKQLRSPRCTVRSA